VRRFKKTSLDSHPLLCVVSFLIEPPPKWRIDDFAAALLKIEKLFHGYARGDCITLRISMKPQIKFVSQRTRAVEHHGPT
jgi:hypothetical protein